MFVQADFFLSDVYQSQGHNILLRIPRTVDHKINRVALYFAFSN